jgi:hypothetical protein
VSKPTKFILGSVVVLLFIVGYKQFKDINLLKTGEGASTVAGREINKNMNNN